MLVRAARRKVQRDALRQIRPSSELYLPWLCPAQLRHQKNIVRSSTTITAPKTDEAKPIVRHYTSLPVRGDRAYSTTAAAIDFSAQNDEHLPFEGLSQAWPPPLSGSSFYSSGRLSDLRDLDPSSYLFLNDFESLELKKLSKRGGIRGSVSEMIVIFEACLKVNSFDRASSILQRMATLYPPESEELSDLHNQYLRAMVGHAIMTRKSEDSMRAALKWVEVEMRAKGLELNATTYAIIIKAALNLLQKPSMDRTVRRYMDMAQKSDIHLEVLDLPILTPMELSRVTSVSNGNLNLGSVRTNKYQICPTDEYPSYDQEDSLETQTTPALSSAVDGLPSNHPSQLQATTQKGLGLESLRKSLSVFHVPITYPDESYGTPEEREALYAYGRQLRMEQDTVAAAIDRWREESNNLAKMGIEPGLRTKNMSTLMWSWHSAMCDALKEELQRVEAAESRIETLKDGADFERCTYGPLLRLISIEQLSAVTILSMLSHFSHKGIDKNYTTTSLVVAIGTSVQQECKAEALKDGDNNGIWNNLRGESARGFRQRKLGLMQTKLSRQQVGPDDAGSDGSGANTIDRHWPATIRAKVGAVLISLMIRSAKLLVTRTIPETGETISQTQPAFLTTHEIYRGKRVGVVKSNSALIDILKKAPVSAVLAKHLPMISPPKSWTGFNEGGLYLYSTTVVRTRASPEQTRYTRAAVQRGDMKQVFAGLDVLGKTSWKVNAPVFDVMVQAWNSGEAIGGLPPLKLDIHYPPEPESSADPSKRYEWIKQVKEIENLKGGLHSQRCSLNFQLEIASALRDEKFYFPHNLDFRGRAYPIPPYLNHMGADPVRGILMFGEGREIGESGLAWLKVHLANVHGHGKASFEERQEFTMEHLDDIYDSVTNPLGGKRWWLTAESPWQCLAVCRELKNALDSPEPTRYITHLPVHQDGTCNGLQHYAALGGDVWGAKQVNLEPSGRPQDVYSAVAELVQAEVAKEAAAGQNWAIDLEGKISRKVVKQTVMTNVYGVTYAGARSQVLRQLQVIFPDKPRGELFSMAGHVSHKIFKALSTMFTGAHGIQQWFGDCANRISTALSSKQIEKLEKQLDRVKTLNPRSKEGRELKHAITESSRFMSSVVWTTPLKMPVVQPYRSSKSTIITTNLQQLSLKEPRPSDPVNKRRQLQAFPPNFIHSLDATHMLLSALKCDEIGLNFAAVHDSFWTHPSDIDKMNRVLRDAFVRMHSEDIIGRLAEEFEARYKGSMYLAQVDASSGLGKRITRFRRSLLGSGKVATRPAPNTPTFEELFVERRRLQLLNSENLDEREEGQNMVTPASIFEEAQGDKEIAISTEAELEGLGLGETQEDSIDESGIEDADNYASDTTDALEDMMNEPEMVPAPPKKTSTKKFVKLWMPLTFPKVPQKVSYAEGLNR
jgi:DNA-directed RNA polymerase, mitochondrial